MKDEVVDPLGHVEAEEWTLVTEATHEHEGREVKLCTVCEEELRSRVIPRLNAAIGRVESELDYVIIGDDIILTLVIENSVPVNSLAVVPIFDDEIFDIVSAEWVVDALIQNIEEGTYRSVSAWSDLEDVNGAVYQIKLHANQLIDHPKTAEHCGGRKRNQG